VQLGSLFKKLAFQFVLRIVARAGGKLGKAQRLQLPPDRCLVEGYSRTPGRATARGLFCASARRLARQHGLSHPLVTHHVAESVALADRVIVIDHGKIALDVEIPLERPRRHGSPELLEGEILDTLFGGGE
jgi:hypothetical protein